MNLAPALAHAPRPLGLPAVFAHRGGWGPQLQNTLPNLESAAKIGANIEYDVHRTADNLLILHHDDDIAGTMIASTTYADLPKLEDGSDAPLFSTALDLGAKYGVKQMIEAKNVGYEADMLAAIARSDAQPGSIFLQSFQPDSVQALRELRADIPTGLLLEPTDADPTGLAGLRRAADIGASYIMPKYTQATDEFLATATAHDLPVITWAPWRHDDAAEIAGLVNDPRIASTIVNRREAGVAAARAAGERF